MIPSFDVSQLRAQDTKFLADSISAGEEHLCLLDKSQHKGSCMGNNNSHQLGNHTSGDAPKDFPVNVDNASNNPYTDFTSITSGGFHTCGLTTGGKIRCWGQNTFGQLGIGKTSEYESATEIPFPGGSQACETTLASGANLGTTKAISSCNGNYTLSMQGDGNLVLYDKQGLALWATNWEGSPLVPNSMAAMQITGNLAIISGKTMSSIWSSDTGNNSGAYLVLQDDGHVAIKLANNVLWQRPK
ncbi:hypothetical protein WDW86_00370 [Bdellovibrionota bacterium FG-2]